MESYMINQVVLNVRLQVFNLLMSGEFPTRPAQAAKEAVDIAAVLLGDGSAKEVTDVKPVETLYNQTPGTTSLLQGQTNG